MVTLHRNALVNYTGICTNMATIDNQGTYNFTYRGYSNEVISGGNLSFNGVNNLPCPPPASNPGSCGNNGIPRPPTPGPPVVKNLIKDLINNIGTSDEQSQKIGQIIRFYVGKKPINLLEGEVDKMTPNNPRAYSLLGGTIVEHSIREADVPTAQTWLTKLEIAEPNNTDIQNYVKMMRIYIKVSGMQTGTQYELTSSDIVDLNTIANSTTMFYNDKACQLLRMRGYGCNGTPPLPRMGNNNNNGEVSELVAESASLNIAPNPTQNSTTISVLKKERHPKGSMTEKSILFTVKIYDMKGVLVKESQLNKGGNFELLKSEVGNGIFFSILTDGDKIIDKQKIIILE